MTGYLQKLVKTVERILAFIVGLGISLLAGLTFLASLALVVAFVLDREIGLLFFVVLVAVFLSPPIGLAGIRIAFRWPNKYGLSLSPGILRVLGAIYGIIGLTVLVITLKNKAFGDLYRVFVMLSIALGAFVLAGMKSEN
jgi:hypothetical protein